MFYTDQIKLNKVRKYTSNVLSQFRICHFFIFWFDLEGGFTVLCWSITGKRIIIRKSTNPAMISSNLTHISVNPKTTQCSAKFKNPGKTPVKK